MYIERESQNIERPLLPVPAFSTQELLPVCEQSVSCMQVSLLVCEWLVLLSLVLLFLRVSSSTIQFLDVLKLACWWHVEPQHYNSAEKLDAQAVSLGGLRANGKNVCSVRVVNNLSLDSDPGTTLKVSLFIHADPVSNFMLLMAPKGMTGSHPHPQVCSTPVHWIIVRVTFQIQIQSVTHAWPVWVWSGCLYCECCVVCLAVFRHFLHAACSCVLYC